MRRERSLFFLLCRAGALLGAVGLLLVLARCDWIPDSPEEQSLVVEMFLETDRRLPALTLRQTRPLSSTDSLGEPGTGAEEVTLVLGDRAIPYTEAAPGRYVSTTDTVVPSLTSWGLTVRWNGTTARAEGSTPPAVTVQEACADVPDAPVRAVQVDSLRRDSLDIPADQGYLYPIDVTVRWAGPPPAASTSWVRTQLRTDASSFPSEVVEFFLEPATIRREDRFERQADARRWEGVYAVPVDSRDAPLPEHDLTAAVVRGDTAFAAFSQTRTDPSRREPLSNVEGALGVALAVSVDSVARDVTDALTEQDEPQCWKPRK